MSLRGQELDGIPPVLLFKIDGRAARLALTFARPGKQAVQAVVVGRGEFIFNAPNFAEHFVGDARFRRIRCRVFYYNLKPAFSCHSPGREARWSIGPAQVCLK